jgi:branched-chain amino acid transport system substrate-binding protein
MIKNFNIIIIVCVLLIQNVNALQNTSTISKTVKIGLLINDYRSVAARNASEMAIEIANKEEGPDGLHFQLVTRSMEGPWGTGSKEAVDLVFNEKVWAILGSHNGRNAHLVEQVIAKTGIVFLSAWASDPTLSQAFVPWYFSCVPNDIQQADALIEEIYNKRKIIKVATVTGKGYDSNIALESLLKQLKTADRVEPLQLFYDSSDKNFTTLFRKINEAKINGIILIGQPLASLNFIEQLRQNKMNPSVFGTLSLLGEDPLKEVDFMHYNNIALVTSGNWMGLKALFFQKEFQKKYGKMPGATAAYAFDGMNLIIDAIKHSGFDRENIQESLSKMHYEGVTGSIQFDDRGNRVNAVDIIEINNGIQVNVRK